MSDSIFRKSSIDRVSSPEQLNDYIKVPSPSIWVMLAAVIILLAGVCVWGIFGKMDTVLPVAVINDGENFYCLVKESDVSKLSSDMTVDIDGSNYAIKEISPVAVPISQEYGDYVMHLGDLELDEWAYMVFLDGTSASGVYGGKITVESVKPISFVLN